MDPSTVTTMVDNVRVTIEEQTDYPFSHTVNVVVRPEKPISFRLYFRDPAWSRETKIDCAGGKIVRDVDFWIVSKQWKPGDRISLEFTAEVKAVEAVNGEFALQYGALLFALPIEHKKTVVKRYPVPGFEDTYYEPLNGTPEQHSLDAELMGSGFGFKPVTMAPQPATLPSLEKPPVKLHGEVLDSTSQRRIALDLVPLGSAPILRRLTFPANPKSRVLQALVVDS